MVGSSDRKMNLETEIPVMTHCKEPALTRKMTLTFFESVKGLILYEFFHSKKSVVFIEVGIAKMYSLWSKQWHLLVG